MGRLMNGSGNLIWVWINTYFYTMALGGWRSINPSYFDVNYRGTWFWPIPTWCLMMIMMTLMFVKLNYDVIMWWLWEWWLWWCWWLWWLWWLRKLLQYTVQDVVLQCTMFTAWGITICLFIMMVMMALMFDDYDDFDLGEIIMMFEQMLMMVVCLLWWEPQISPKKPVDDDDVWKWWDILICWLWWLWWLWYLKMFVY